jgi:hypothetical protein
LQNTGEQIKEEIQLKADRPLNEILKIPAELPEGSSTELSIIFKNRFSLSLENFKYKNDTSSEKVPFSIKTVSGKKYIFLPSNLDQLMEDKTWSILLLAINSSGHISMKCDTEVVLNKTNENQRLFFAGYFNRLLRSPEDLSKLNFSSGKSRSETGRACADAEVFTRLSGILGASNFLPDTVKYGDKKGKLLTSELSLLGGAKGLLGLGDIQHRIADITSDLIKSFEQPWKKVIEATNVTYGQVINPLTNKKKKDIIKDGKKQSVMSPIHLVRPSKIVEAMTDSDIRILKELDAPWDQMKEFAEQFASGVPILQIPFVTEEYKKIYSSQQETIEKLTAWRATRRNVIKETLKAIYPKKTPEYKSSMNEEIFSHIIDTALDKDHSVKDVMKLDSLCDRHLEKILGIPTNPLITGNIICDVNGLLSKVLKTVGEQQVSDLRNWSNQFNNSKLTDYIIDTINASQEVRDRTEIEPTVHEDLSTGEIMEMAARIDYLNNEIANDNDLTDSEQRELRQLTKALRSVRIGGF